MTRQRDVEQLAVLVAELVDEFRTTEIHDWRPTRDELARTNPAYAAQVTGPDGRARWAKDLPAPERRKHQTREAGLLEQLRRGQGRRRAIAKPDPLGYKPDLGYRATVDAWSLIGDMAPTPGTGGSGGGHTKPTSRPPAGLQAAETLLEIAADIAAMRARVRHRAGRGRGHASEPAAMLRELLDLALRATGEGWLVDDRMVRQITAAARSWAASARLALRYDAPVATLRSTHCPTCGGQLRVRSDASSNVWCAGVKGRVMEGPALEGDRWPLPDRGCGAKWPRLAWLDLLAGDDGGSAAG